MQGSPIIVDGMGSAALLPAAQVPPPAYNGVPWLDRALAAGLTAMNVTMGTQGVAQGADDFRAYLHSVHGYLSYFEMEPRLLHVRSTADIVRAKAEGRLGICAQHQPISCGQRPKGGSASFSDAKSLGLKARGAIPA